MTSDGRGTRGVLRRRRGASDPQVLADLAEFKRLRAIQDAQAIDLLDNPAMLARGNAGDRFLIRPHARVIGAELARLEDQAATSTRFQGLIVTTPPQIGKSTLVTEWGAFWWLCLDSRRRVMCACYGDDLAVNRGSNTQQLVKEYGRPYGLQLRYGSTAVKDWSLTAGGGMRSVGIQSGSTGFSADRLVIDDPHKDRKDAQSKASRNAVWDWWSSTGSQRLQPGSIVVIVLTRWHDDDIAGRVIKQQGLVSEGGRWNLLHIPGFADPEFGPDPLGRRPGEPLPHPKIRMDDAVALREHWQDKRETMTVRDFYALIQGDPRPAEGALVTAEFLETIREWDVTMRPDPVRVAVAVDPSGGGRDTAGIVAGFRGSDGRLWVTHDWTDVLSAEDWARYACQLAAEIGAGSIVLESNYGGDMVSLTVRATWEKLRAEWLAAKHRELNAEHGATTPKEQWEPLRAEHYRDCPYGEIPPAVKRRNAKAGKLLRAEPIAQQMFMDKVRLGCPLPALEHEWATWQQDDPDSPGRVDALTYLAYELLQVPGASDVISTAKISRSRTGAPHGGARISRK